MSRGQRVHDTHARNPLVRRTIAGGLVGVALTASTLFGAGQATAGDLALIERALDVVDAVPGQQVAVDPSTMDLKVREAVLLSIPFAFDTAAQAADRFAAQSPIVLGSAEEGTRFYSGRDLAVAAQPRIGALGLPEDKVDSITAHFRNLVSLGNGATVRASPPEPPPEPTPRPEPSPAPAPEPPPPPEDTTTPPPPPAPTDVPTTGLPPNAVSGAFVPGATVAPNYAYVPGQLPPWLQTRLGHVPSMSPDLNTLLRQSEDQKREQEKREEVQEAGKAEAMPADGSKRVALPVLVAAIALAVVTAALVRTWVLRRQ
jgi:hypothetical protein